MPETPVTATADLPVARPRSAAPDPTGPERGAALPGDGTVAAVRLLLVEDDTGDALLVEEFLADGDLDVTVQWVRSVAEALPLVPRSDCVLLDLGLPDSFGLDGLRSVLSAGPRSAVIVLTGLSDRGRGAEAVASGAQDYLIKAEVDASLLGRSILYAIERRRADEATRRLFEADFQRAVNARIQRGLLPRPLLRDASLSISTRYRPGGGGDVLGGDFYDAVELEDGRVRVVVGDVAGHGPDEAALGVSLRIAWRTLVLAETPDHRILPALDAVLVAERQHDETFVTLCDLTLAPDRATAAVRIAGHPAPVLVDLDATSGGVSLFPDRGAGPVLGVIPACWEPVAVDLPAHWAVLLYTDGLIEGRFGGGPERLGMDRVVECIGKLGSAMLSGSDISESGDQLLGDLIAWAEDEHGGPLPDDVALCLLAGSRASARTDTPAV